MRSDGFCWRAGSRKFPLSALFTDAFISAARLEDECAVTERRGPSQGLVEPRPTNQRYACTEVTVLKTRTKCSTKLSPPTCANTWKAVNKLHVCQENVLMLRVQWTKSPSLPTHSQILEWTSCHNAFSAAKDHNH